MENNAAIKKNQGGDLLGWRIASYILIGIFTLTTIIPLVWLTYSSFKPHQEIILDPLGWPDAPTFHNYELAWKLGEFGILFGNSIFYSTVATVITVLLALMCGYAFAKFGFKITGFLYTFFLGGLLITVHSILVPLFVMESFVGIDDTRWGVLIPYVALGLPFQLFLATSYLKSIPDSLEEAALIDGTGYMGIFWRIVLPMSAPVMATMLIYCFLGNWNEFVLIMVLTSRQAVRSLPAGINAFAGTTARDYGVQFAALMYGTVPILIFYAAFSKQIKKGFAAGSLKE